MLQQSFGHNGSKDGCFFHPTDVAVGMDGAIYVADSGNHRIQCFRSNGMFVWTRGGMGNGEGEFDSPQGVATGIDGRTKELALVALSTIPELSVFPPGLLPICASYIGDECVVVSDTYNNRMQIYEVDGKFVRRWGSHGDARGEFEWPHGCEVDANGLVYVADFNNNRIQVFDMRGIFIRMWGGADGGEQLNGPAHIAVGDDGALHVADSGNRRVVCYRANGTLVHQMPSPSALCTPRGVSVDHEMVYVSDVCNHCIWQCRLDGTIVRKWRSEGGVDVPFRPGGLSKIVKGMLYVADIDGHRIFVLSETQTES